MSPSNVIEEARSIPIIDEADICVLGGSCTGLFAAIRAARLGARVIIVERMGAFGGVATISLVNVWHSPQDEVFQRTIIGGLTVETMERLKRRNAVKEMEKSAHWKWSFNPFELMIELDELVQENRIRPWLHTAFAAPWVKDGQLSGVFVENKSGRGLIKANQFIDATGDGDLCARLGLETYYNGRFQPATTCAILEGWTEGFHIQPYILEHGAEFGLPPGFQWGAHMPGTKAFMLAGTRVHHADCSQAEQFTAAEMEGRRQVRATLDLIRKHAPEVSLNLVGLPARIGIRESRHVRAHYNLTGDDVLLGRRFPDAIANGSYRVDIHHQDKPGLTFRYLDGRESYVTPGKPSEEGRWRPETAENPTFYQIPYRSMVPAGPYSNLLMAGRMIDADQAAHGAIRVMVNMNQTGEAAGVAAVMALESGKSVAELNTESLRRKLAEGGSVII